MKARVTHFTVEVRITSLSMDMDHWFNEYSLMWSGGRLPREPGRNKTKKKTFFFLLLKFCNFYFLFEARGVSSQVEKT